MAFLAPGKGYLPDLIKHKSGTYFAARNSNSIFTFRANSKPPWT